MADIAVLSSLIQTMCNTLIGKEKQQVMLSFNPNRSLDFGEIARLCHAACFSPSRRRSGLRRGVARNRMRTEAGKMPECLIFLIRNGLGVSNDRFGFNDFGESYSRLSGKSAEDFGEVVRTLHI